MENREIEIAGVVNTALTHNEFYEKFIAFVESLDSTFGGWTCESDQEGMRVTTPRNFPA